MENIRKTALTAMILAIVSVALCWTSFSGWVGLVFAIGGIVCGILALNMAKKVKDEATEAPERVFVKVASICGLIGVIAGAVLLVIGLICNIVACSAQAALNNMDAYGDAYANAIAEGLEDAFSMIAF